MGGKPFVVACIPALDEERTIAKVAIQAMKFVDKVVVVDDGSSDMTGEIAERLGAEVIRHERNMGYGASLASLFRRAREIGPDVMVTLDGDGQHRPDDIPNLVKPVFDGKADVVIGSRFLDEKSGNSIPGYRRKGIKLITDVTRAVSFDHITDAQSGYRAYSRKALGLIDPTEYGMGASTEILLLAKEHGLSVVEVPAEIDYDGDSNSSNPLTHGVGVILSMVKHISMKRPLLFYGVPGFLALVIAAMFWVWTLQVFAATRQVITNVALIAIGATIVGLMLLTTGIILWVLVSAIREKV